MHFAPFDGGSFGRRRFTRGVALGTSFLCAGAVLFPDVAHAQSSTLPPPVIPVVVQVEPPTTAAATTTAAPTTAATTTAAPTTTPATTAQPSTTVTSPPTTVTSSTPTTKPKTKPDRGKPDPSARGATSIEVDISAQRLYLYKGGQLARVIPVSTGTGRRYCEKGSCGVARTPRGRFRIGHRINGWRTSRLGKLYNPLYFSGGYAIHGGRIPGYPASHGCVRIPMGVASWFPSQVPNGTPVWIHD
jgi:lipoprotein-anchoring transpeptidase ErfK/SrfK